MKIQLMKSHRQKCTQFIVEFKILKVKPLTTWFSVTGKPQFAKKRQFSQVFFSSFYITDAVEIQRGR